MGREWVAALARVPLFAGLSQRQLRSVARLAEQVQVPAGAPVVFRAAPGSEFFVILDGTAVAGPPTREQHHLGPGEFFGEMSVIDGRPRSAAVRAETDLTLMVLGRAAFLRLLREQPSVGIAVMTELAARVRRLESATPRS
jgi:CRP/FNR family transcriptional regulator, cyclic AMP receptor protein